LVPGAQIENESLDFGESALKPLQPLIYPAQSVALVESGRGCRNARARRDFRRRNTQQLREHAHVGGAQLALVFPHFSDLVGRETQGGANVRVPKAQLGKPRIEPVAVEKKCHETQVYARLAALKMLVRGIEVGVRDVRSAEHVAVSTMLNQNRDRVVRQPDHRRARQSQ